MQNETQDNLIYRIFYKEIDKYPVLSGADQIKLFRKIAQLHKNKKSIQAIKEKLINSNMRMVIMIAFEYVNRKIANNSNSYVQLMDMIQAGAIGLMRAVEKFNPEHGVLFSSYAGVAIRHAIEKEIQSQRFIRIPHEHFKYLSQLSRLKDEYGEALTDEIIRKELKITETFLKILKKNVFTNRTDDVEFDTLLDYYDTEDNFAYKTTHKSEQSELNGFFKKFVSKLRPKEQLYITEKFLSNQSIMESDIAKKYNVTRQYVNITIIRGLERLKKLMQEEGVDSSVLRTMSIGGD